MMSFEPLTFVPLSGKNTIENKGTEGLAMVKALVVNNDNNFSRFPSTSDI